MLKTSWTRSSFQLARAVAKRPSISLTAHAGISHVAPRYNSVPPATEEDAPLQTESRHLYTSSQSLESCASQTPSTDSAPALTEDASPPADQNLDTPSQQPQSSSPHVPAKAPQPRSEVLLPFQASTIDAVEGMDPALEDETGSGVETEAAQSELFNPNFRPMSEYELEKKYYEGDKVAKSTDIYPIPPAAHLVLNQAISRDVMVMYRAMNESIKEVQSAIQYDFKDPTLLLAALQNYTAGNGQALAFFPLKRLGEHRHIYSIGHTVVRLAVVNEIHKRYVSLKKLDAFTGLATKQLAQQGMKKGIYKHLYRYNVDTKVREEVVARSVAAILGAVWLDSGKKWTSVEKFMSVMDIEFQKKR